jgi:hypothetical protein
MKKVFLNDVWKKVGATILITGSGSLQTDYKFLDQV